MSERTICGIIRAFSSLHDEAAIDLDPRQRKFEQVAQRRIAGAEVVEGEIDAFVPQPLQQFRLLEVERDILGDFELQHLRRQAEFAQCIIDVGKQRRITELNGEQVQPDAFEPQSGLRPARRMSARTSGAIVEAPSVSMKTPGKMMPRSRWRQRIRASAPTTDWSTSRTWGWKWIGR